MSAQTQTDLLPSSSLSCAQYTWSNPLLPLPHPAFLCPPCLPGNPYGSPSAQLSIQDEEECGAAHEQLVSGSKKPRLSAPSSLYSGQSRIPYAIQDMLGSNDLPNSLEDKRDQLTCAVNLKATGESDVFCETRSSRTLSTRRVENKLHCKDSRNSIVGIDRDSALPKKFATRESTSYLRAWLQQHQLNPYPTKGEKIMLALVTRMNLTQISTWFANARRRLKKENQMTWCPRIRQHLSGTRESRREKSSAVVVEVDSNHNNDRLAINSEGDLSDQGTADRMVQLFNTQLFSHLVTNPERGSREQLWNRNSPTGIAWNRSDCASRDQCKGNQNTDSGITDEKTFSRECSNLGGCSTHQIKYEEVVQSQSKSNVRKASPDHQHNTDYSRNNWIQETGLKRTREESLVYQSGEVARKSLYPKHKQKFWSILDTLEQS